MNSTTILIKGFKYDGESPDAFFLGGTQGQPSKNGEVVMPYPFEGKHFKYDDYDIPILGRFDGKKDVVLHLPPGSTVDQLKWISVWCRKSNTNFGHVEIPRYLFSSSVYSNSGDEGKEEEKYGGKEEEKYEGKEEEKYGDKEEEKYGGKEEEKYGGKEEEKYGNGTAEEKYEKEGKQGECVFTPDCYKSNHSCAAEGGPGTVCTCLFGKCTPDGFGLCELGDSDCEPDYECDTYKDCECKSDPKNCFCHDGKCTTEAWECHKEPGVEVSKSPEECGALEKCKGKKCSCVANACENECDKRKDCKTRTDLGFAESGLHWCNDPGFKCKCTWGICEEIKKKKKHESKKEKYGGKEEKYKGKGDRFKGKGDRFKHR